MSQRSVCSQFAPQLWRATKCKFCFNDKSCHEVLNSGGGKENNSNTAAVRGNKLPTPPPPVAATSPTKPITPSYMKREIDTDSTHSTDTDSNRIKRTPPPLPPSRIKLPTYDEKEKLHDSSRISISSPIENINLRLEMNKQLLAKDDKIHTLEIKNQNQENEIRNLKEQNIQLSKTQRSVEDEKKLLDKIASLKRKLTDYENKYNKTKDEKEDLEERLKAEEQAVSKLKIKVNSLEHEQYMLELRVEREHKHKQSMQQEKEDLEIELESLRKAYRSMQRESRKFSATLFDVDEERTRDLEDQLRQTERRLGMLEGENNRLKDKITRFENDKQDGQIQSLQQQLTAVQGDFNSSKNEIEELRVSHLAEIKSLQTEISRLQFVNEELSNSKTRVDFEVEQMRRELQSADFRNTDSESKDEELNSLRIEVSRLQDKCSALRDVELIHINLNKELDRQRDRGDKAEQLVRQLEREVEEERRKNEELRVTIKELRQKESEYKKPLLLAQLPPDKSSREPAERDTTVYQQVTATKHPARYYKYKTRGLRKYKSLQNLIQDPLLTTTTATTTTTNTTTESNRSNHYYTPTKTTSATTSVEDLKNMFEGRSSTNLGSGLINKRSVSLDSSVYLTNMLSLLSDSESS